MEHKIQIIFFLVAIIFTILNIRERFFSNKVRVWEDIKTTTTTQFEPLYMPYLDLSDPGDKEVIRDGVPHVGVRLCLAGLQCHNSLQIWICEGV